jgi:hypothetical protein
MVSAAVLVAWARVAPAVESSALADCSLGAGLPLADDGPD